MKMAKMRWKYLYLQNVHHGGVERVGAGEGDDGARAERGGGFLQKTTYLLPGEMCLLNSIDNGAHLGSNLSDGRRFSIKTIRGIKQSQRSKLCWKE